MELPIVRPDIAQYAKLALTRTGYVAGQVEVVSSCFQRCRACESWRDDLKGVVRGSWPLDALKQLCKELADRHPFESLTLTGGDPQAWPHLDAFLDWWPGAMAWSRVKLRINTALTQDFDPKLWCCVDEVTVSLDAVERGLYTKIRGDKETDPADVIERMRKLAGCMDVSLQTRTTVMEQNMEHCLEVLARLARLVLHGFPLRKAQFLAVIGDRADRPEQFWKLYESLRVTAKEVCPEVPTSFEESVSQTREFLVDHRAKEIPCYAGNISFHAKANGDWYPCCLAGGEAITTYPQLRIGNYFDELDHGATAAVARLLRRYHPGCHYGNDAMPCSQICQWKQLNINVAAHAASQTHLTMP